MAEQAASKRRLAIHVAGYIVVNAILVGAWYLTTPDSLFWPGVPLMGWSVGLLYHIWAVYPPTGTRPRAARRPATNHRPRLS
jgi:hypothetical protein